MSGIQLNARPNVNIMGQITPSVMHNIAEYNILIYVFMSVYLCTNYSSSMTLTNFFLLTYKIASRVHTGMHEDIDKKYSNDECSKSLFKFRTTLSSQRLRFNRVCTPMRFFYHKAHSSLRLHRLSKSVRNFQTIYKMNSPCKRSFVLSPWVTLLLTKRTCPGKRRTMYGRKYLYRAMTKCTVVHTHLFSFMELFLTAHARYYGCIANKEGQSLCF